MASLVCGATNTADQGGCAHGQRRAATRTIPAEIPRAAITPSVIICDQGPVATPAAEGGFVQRYL